MSKLTTKQFIKKQEKKLKEITKKGIPLGRAVATVHAMQTKRIFEQGGAVVGKIGTYNSTDPLYVNPKEAPRSFPPRGKTGKTAFKSGKAHKTGFFSSYKAFRASQGRETSFVNLRLTSRLFLDFSNGLIKISAVKWTSGVKSLSNADKIAENERRFGRIFDLRVKERKEFLKINQIELTKALQ